MISIKGQKYFYSNQIRVLSFILKLFEDNSTNSRKIKLKINPLNKRIQNK